MEVMLPVTSPGPGIASSDIIPLLSSSLYYHYSRGTLLGFIPGAAVNDLFAINCNYKKLIENNSNCFDSIDCVVEDSILNHLDTRRIAC